MTARRFILLSILAFFVGVSLWQSATRSPITSQVATANLAPTTTIEASSDTAQLGTYYDVVRVVDGDTLVVNESGKDATVRVIGLDTPEVVDPRKPAECFGAQASAEAKKILMGQRVHLEGDPTQDAKDKYGRTLAYVFLPDGTLFELFMIENGFGKEYTYRTAYEHQAEFKAAESKARSAQLGLWSPATCNGNTGIGSKPISTQ